MSDVCWTVSPAGSVLPPCRVHLPTLVPVASENGNGSSPVTVSTKPVFLPSSKLAETCTKNDDGVIVAGAVNEMTRLAGPGGTCPRSHVRTVDVPGVTEQPVGSPVNAPAESGSGPVPAFTVART